MISRRHSLLAIILVVVGLSCAGKEPTGSSTSGKASTTRPGVSEIALPAEDKIVAGQTIYVPLYSHVYTSDNAQTLNLASTLFVRNTDPNRAIILTRVEYFDSGGKSLRKFLKSPVKIEPLASIDFFVKESDETGGASPSFIVQWISTDPVTDPITESVMIGTSGTQGISFACPGQIIARR
jgi:hypothetical protein